MNKQDEELLQQNGWTIVCYSPFEIQHEDGSFASLNAAQIVLDSLKQSSLTYEKCTSMVEEIASFIDNEVEKNKDSRELIKLIRLIGDVYEDNSYFTY